MGDLLSFPGDSLRRTPPTKRSKASELTLDGWAESWKLHLDGYVADTTVKLYLAAVHELTSYMKSKGIAPILSCADKVVVLGCLDTLRQRTSSSTADTRRRGLVQFFRWLTEEQAIQEDDNPMSGVRPRKFVEKVIEPLADEVVTALLNDTSGRDFRSLRDRCLVRVFLDSGGRLSEIARLEIGDVDLNLSQLKVLGKGGRERYIPIGRKARVELDRYLRARSDHQYADSQRLWLGPKGPLTPSGIYQVMSKRGTRLGYEVRPHAFRHTFSHHFLANGGNEHSLAHLNGWTSTRMVGRYARSTQAGRAREEHRRLSPGDRF